MKIKILSAHNTETNRTSHTCILIDDILALDAGALTSQLSKKSMLGLKGVLLTHSHYDHIRDIPALAINLYLNSASVDIYTHQIAWNNLTGYLLNGTIYPEYHKKPAANPTLRFHPLEHLKTVNIAGYDVLPIKVNHAVPAFGYQVNSPQGKKVLYTGDTGGDLSEVWKIVHPDILLIEVTASNRWEHKIKDNGHLTPHLLQKELSIFHQLKSYYPLTFAVHLNPGSEDEIKSELEQTGTSLGIHIHIAKKGMVLNL